MGKKAKQPDVKNVCSGDRKWRHAKQAVRRTFDNQHGLVRWNMAW
ncbi:MAG: hypothetical protein R2860_17495 [Desulfobacterales bacterium]